ncbi:DUF6270 domain-containing protein [Butyrivibrio sp. WCE2006]|uniref:DUF6270 domain-containing protein n=1 Tax=Butyrivibrio sp. WCE2006 TaxID=1410611 RepID=UPI0005D2CBB6|nr:DUF6270 domain-containing protein [Butyrivibrio sp. WCE2006]
MSWKFPSGMDDVEMHIRSEIKISLLGCCVIRDIFGLHDNDGGYFVKRFVQDVSPISLVTQSPLLHPLTDEYDWLFDGKSRFWGKCQKLELQKRVLEYIAEEPFDYLIFDVAEFRRKLLYFSENQGWFSENYYLRSFLQRYIESGVVPSEYEIINPMEMDRTMCLDFLYSFSQALLGICPPERLILVEIKAGLPYTTVDRDPLVKAEIETAKLFNERMSFAYEVVKDNMPGIHVVEFPQNVKIDPNHKWGRNLLHYTMEYYDYALDAVNAITDNSCCRDNDAEKKLLAELKTGCENIISGSMKE